MERLIPLILFGLLIYFLLNFDPKAEAPKLAGFNFSVPEVPSLQLFKKQPAEQRSPKQEEIYIEETIIEEEYR